MAGVLSLTGRLDFLSGIFYAALYESDNETDPFPL